MAQRITAEEFEEKVLNSIKPVLVDFYSDSCIACKKLSPVLSDIEERWEEKLTVYKVNTNYEVQLAEQYQILSQPTLILFWNGEEAGRVSGVLKETELTGWLAGIVPCAAHRMTSADTDAHSRGYN